MLALVVVFTFSVDFSVYLPPRSGPFEDVMSAGEEDEDEEEEDGSDAVRSEVRSVCCC